MKKLLMFGLFFGLSAILSARIDFDAGSRGGVLSRIDPSARASGMGGAFTSIEGDVGALSWNPALMKTITERWLCLTYGDWFLDTNYGNVGYGFQLDDDSGLGFGLTYFSNGEMTRVSELDVNDTPIEGETFGANDLKLSAGYARKFILPDTNKYFNFFNKYIKKDILYGGSLNFTNKKIDSESAFGFSFDLGVSCELPEKIGLGIAVRNLGSGGKMDEKTDKLPPELRIGFNRSFYPRKDNSILASVDAVSSTDDKYHFLLGGEYGFKDTYFFRTGFKINYDTNWLTLGCGTRYKQYKIDYAFVPYKILGNTHRITLSYLFGSSKENVAEKSENVEPLAPEPAPAPVEASVEAPVTAEVVEISTPTLTPEPKTIIVKEEKRGLVVNLASSVLFESGKSELKPASYSAMNEVVKLMQEYPENDVVIEGHTDSLGSNEYNQKLSEKRAQVVVDVLISKYAVDSKRVKAVGYGEEKPLADNKTAVGREQNRRVEIIILKKDKPQIDTEIH